MSSAVVSTSAASGRLFVFDEEPGAPTRPSSAATKKPAAPDSRGESVLAQVLQATIKNQQSAISITPASQLAVRPAPEMASSGIAALDALTGGLPRGCLTEIFGPASSGRTTVLLAALAAATRREEFCALVDASDALDPQSAATSGVDLDRLLWVRCGANPPRRHGVTVKSENENPGCPTLLSRSVRKRVGSSVTTHPELRPGNLSLLRASHRAGSARHRSSARKRRLRPDRSRPRRSAAGSGAPYPTDHMVPLSPRRRIQIDHSAGDRTTTHRWKLLVAGAATRLTGTSGGNGIMPLPRVPVHRTQHHMRNSSIAPQSQSRPQTCTSAVFDTKNRVGRITGY